MTPALAQRIAVTIGALLLFRLGEYIPLPGVNPEAWAMLTHGEGGGIAGFFAASSAGVRRLAIFALGLVPYVSAAVLVQLATIVSRRLRARARDGEPGRAAMVRYARYVTVLLTALQALGVANGLEHVNGVVAHPGLPFVLSTVVTLTGGTMFLVWLADQITTRGIGNGIALILLTGLVTELPREIATALEFMRQYRVASEQLVAVTLIVVAVTAVVAVVELARRRLPILYSARAIGGRQLHEQKSDLSLKLNPAGIVPVLLASFVMSVLVAGLGFFAGFESSLVAQLRAGSAIHLVLYALLIIFCTFFYTAFVLDPEESADSLGKLGGSLPGIAAGEPTAACLDRIVSRTTLIGAIYLALVCLLPDLLMRFLQVPVYFGGTALLIAVCALIDLRAQFQAELRSRARP
ncbi:MAG: preprotein translocase subunit SecY [Hyphomicrobiales bacterium]|nr:preprotein translocase subunit SecY [Hyphomicrobiales bacterium]MBV8824552.1 preprotein translocase subunit SecY [Hyphomicrobiales bacterium]MBV9426874.1 preprotein translocase subunit SecY [Bradyrhizobiaceae bacterium]